MFIELLLTSPESRQLQLLNVIRTQRRIEFTEIAKILQWPYVSTQQVYRRLLKNYRLMTGKQISKPALVEQCDWIYHQLAQSLIRNSVGYQCLMAAVKEEPKPLLSVGEVTIQSRLKPLVAWLKKYQLTYDPQTNVITGDERVIRLFGWQLSELGGTTFDLTAEQKAYLKSLTQSIPDGVVKTRSMERFLQITAIRLAKLKFLAHVPRLAAGHQSKSLVQFSSLPAKAKNIQFDLTEIYWLQYMVIYSSYFVDTNQTSLVQPRERKVLPYLIQLVVKTVIARLKVFQSPLYFEQLDEYLMETIQFAILLNQPAIRLDQADDGVEVPHLRDAVMTLARDIPELSRFVDLIVKTLSTALKPFLPQTHVELSYPDSLDDYTVGTIQQQLRTRFEAINWHLQRVREAADDTLPTFTITVEPTQPAKDQYYWLPWLSVSNNIELLVNKVRSWLQHAALLAVNSDEAAVQ